MFKLVVLSCVLAVASAGVVAPIGWAGAWGRGLGVPLATPLAAPIAAPLGIATPLAVNGGHIIGKRSAVLPVAPWSAGLAVPAGLAAPLAAPVVGTWGATPWAAPLAAPLGIGGHIIRKRSAVLPAAPVLSAGLAVPTALAASPLIGAWGAAPLARATAWGAPLW